VERFITRTLPGLLRKGDINAEQVQQAVGVVALIAVSLNPNQQLAKEVDAATAKVIEDVAFREGMSLVQLRQDPRALPRCFPKYLERAFKENPALVTFGRMLRELPNR
jgi:hypothetical protein